MQQLLHSPAAPVGCRPFFPPPSRLPENSMSSKRCIFASFCSNDPAGHDVSNWIACYNPSENTLSFVSRIPDLIENHVLKDFAMVSIGDSIYIIGGRLCSKDRAENVDGSEEFYDVDVKILPSVYNYNTISRQWSKCAPLNVPRYNFACTIWDNKIYVAGGQSTLGSARAISSAEVYDPVLDRWVPLQDMTRKRYKCVGVTWQGKIYVVGGFVEGGMQYVERCSADVYDVASDQWGLVAGMWQLDVPPNQIVDVDGRLFSSGDCLTAWKGHIEAYDGQLNIWYMVEGSQKRFFPCEEIGQPIERLYLTMAPLGSHLYFLVGYRTTNEPSKTISMVHSFDTSEGRWKSFEPIQYDGERELCSHCCVVHHS
nr:kelch-like protein 8 [Ipomoea batatas]